MSTINEHVIPSWHCLLWIYLIYDEGIASFL